MKVIQIKSEVYGGK